MTAGTGCGDKQRGKKKRLGVTLSCQLALGANTHVMHGKTKRGKVRYKRFRHCLLSFFFFLQGGGAVCLREEGSLIFLFFFCFGCLSVFTSQVYVASTQRQTIYLRRLNRGGRVPRCRLRAKLWLRRWWLLETRQRREPRDRGGEGKRPEGLQPGSVAG